MPSVLVILHPGVEEMEATAPIDLLRRAEVKVTTAAPGTTRLITGKTGIGLQADTLLDHLSEELFDAVVIPGGPGIKALRHHQGVRDLVNRHWEADKWVAAICAGPLVLLDAGILTDQAFTSHASTQEELPARRADERVVEDGRLITSQGAGTATDFGLTLIERLVDADTRKAVADSIAWSV
ncbi:MAG: DJ-1 family glyoxalase III [Opitutales bacterium]